jgi:hypothetical protein
VKAEWDVDLYKYDKYVSEDFLRNGPTNVITGYHVMDIGKAYLGQEDIKIELPYYLEPGYYYFRFGGKAAGDSSPAIQIVENSSDDVVEYSSEKEQIEELMKILIDLIRQLMELKARG